MAKVKVEALETLIKRMQPKEYEGLRTGCLSWDMVFGGEGLILGGITRY
jgi:hypothetical protein